MRFGECVDWYHSWETVPTGGWTGPVKLIERCRRCGARRDPATQQPIVPYTTELRGDTKDEGDS